MNATELALTHINQYNQKRLNHGLPTMTDQEVTAFIAGMGAGIESSTENIKLISNSAATEEDGQVKESAPEAPALALEAQ